MVSTTYQLWLPIEIDYPVYLKYNEAKDRTKSYNLVLESFPQIVIFKLSKVLGKVTNA